MGRRRLGHFVRLHELFFPPQRTASWQLLASLGGTSSSPVTFLLHVFCILYTAHTTVRLSLTIYCTRGTHILCFTLTVYCTHCILCTIHCTTHGSAFSALFCILLYLINALVFILQLWVYTYFPRLAPVPVTETPLVVPFSRRFDGRCTRRPRETFGFFRRYFDTITPAKVCFTCNSFKLHFILYCQ